MVDGDDGERVDAGAEIEHGPHQSSATIVEKLDHGAPADGAAGPGRLLQMDGEVAIEEVVPLEQEKAERRGGRGVAHPLGEEPRGMIADCLGGIETRATVSSRTGSLRLSTRSTVATLTPDALARSVTVGLAPSFASCHERRRVRAARRDATMLCHDVK